MFVGLLHLLPPHTHLTKHTERDTEDDNSTLHQNLHTLVPTHPPPPHLTKHTETDAGENSKHYIRIFVLWPSIHIAPPPPQPCHTPPPHQTYRNRCRRWKFNITSKLSRFVPPPPPPPPTTNITKHTETDSAGENSRTLNQNLHAFATHLTKDRNRRRRWKINSTRSDSESSSLPPPPPPHQTYRNRYRRLKLQNITSKSSC